jgi:hypothetical protein
MGLRHTGAIAVPINLPAHQDLPRDLSAGLVGAGIFVGLPIPLLTIGNQEQGDTLPG